MRKNKLLLLLALLLTAATGAWAQEPATTYSVKKLTVPNTWTGDMTTFSAADLPSDFAAVGDDVVTTIPAPTATGNVVLIYGFSGGETKFVEYANGVQSATDSRDFPRDQIYGYVNIMGYEGVYYTAAAGTAAAGYSVSLKDGVKDADKWTVKVGEGQAQALPIGGLKGDGSETVTLQYTGRLKVKGVKATSEAAPAEASVPDGALSGKFSVSDGKQVYFSKGNLRYESSKWSFFDNQYDYYSSYSADAWDHFGWSTSATDYGKNTSTTRSDYSGDFVDWGATMGTGWRMLTSDEWTYLLKTRSASTVGGTENGRYAKAKVNNVRGVILFPDTYTHPDGVTAPTGVNVTGDTGWNGNSYTAEDWTKMETAGCVFLPAAGYRNGSMVNNPGSVGDYSSATPSGTEKAYELYFSSGSLNTASEGSRFYGLSVRLVSEVTTSDAEPAAKEPATVTAAPTGAAIVGVGKTTALVSGGAAEGGSMMYAVTTTNTMPTSTDGFSDAVPTAESIIASGKVYVWYYVKGDDTHSDSEIAATAIEVTVMAVPITVTWNPSDIVPKSLSDKSFTKDGITFTAATCDFQVLTFGGGGSFTTTLGNFTKIEISADYAGEVSGTGWSNDGWQSATWTGNAASVSFSGDIWGGGMTCEGGNLKIVFTIE